MFEKIGRGEHTLCEFEVIKPMRDLDFDLPHLSSGILNDIFGPLSRFSEFSSLCPSSSSPSSPYSFLSPPSPPHTSSPPRLHHFTHPKRRCVEGSGRTLFATDFRPIRTLGKGGHGTVYLVQDTMSERYLAMKVIEKNGLRVREYAPIFEEQAVSRRLATATVGSDRRTGLVPLLGSFEDSDNFYFVTEYCPGGDLGKLIKQNGVVHEHQARIWCAELLVALEHLHEQRIVHRDIKPENILIDADGHIALTDFGIARAFGTIDEDRPWRNLSPWNTPQIPQGDDDHHAADKDDRDETCSMVGTPGYTAPEVYSGKYSYEVDVWGAGVVLHNMLTGKLPFGLEPHAQRLEEVIERTDILPADHGLRGTINEDARDMLMQMLEKEPSKRPSIDVLKNHRWFRGINWATIHRIIRHGGTGSPAYDAREDEEVVYIQHGRPYGVFDKAPHEWFEWVSPSLGKVENSFDTASEWSWESTCFSDLTHTDGGFEMAPIRRSKVIQKMKRWLKKLS